MKLGYRGGISVGEIIVYSLSLVIATGLAIRHGFGRSGGWLFLITFSLARIIGAAFQLSTISDPNNVSNYTAAAILTNIGFAPLELATLALLSRLITNINRSRKTFVTTRMVKIVELILTVGVILGIIGGIDAGNDFSTTGKFILGSKSVAGTSLLLVAFGLTILGVVFISFDRQYADKGEHRIFFAIAASLPFLLVRLVYSCLSTFSHNKDFGLISGNTTILLCVALLEELAVVIIFEGVGLTLKKSQHATSVSSSHSDYPIQRRQNSEQPKKKDHIAIRIVKSLIIVRIVMAIVKAVRGKKGGKNGDAEMHGR